MYRIVFEELNDEVALADTGAPTLEDLRDAPAVVQFIQRQHDARAQRGREPLHPGVAGADVICTRTGQTLATPVPKV